MRIVRGTFKILLWLIGGLVGLLAVGFVALWFYSPGEAQPIVDADGVAVAGSVSTIEPVTLGGVEQSLIIRGRDATAPVLLFLHGGPGAPEYPFIRQMNPGLEDDFVVVYWEQRGGGMAFQPSNPPGDMNIAQFVADATELSEMLIPRFDQEKLYLVGHSWGSVLGLLTAEARPDLFHAYIGIGNVAHQSVGERMGLEWALERSIEVGDSELQTALAALEVPKNDAGTSAWLAFMRVQRGALDQMGGGMTHAPTGITDIISRLFVMPEYKATAKLNFLRGAFFSVGALWEEIVGLNLIEDVNTLEIPVYFAQGAYDFQTPIPLAQALFDSLEAPHKEFVVFEDSAHSPFLEEPEKFNALVRHAAGME